MTKLKRSPTAARVTTLDPSPAAWTVAFNASQISLTVFPGISSWSGAEPDAPFFDIINGVRFYALVT
jgi:hypothetical protein